MIGLYADGTKVGTLANAERLIPKLIGDAKTVELRDEPTGRRLGTFSPNAQGVALG